MSRTIELVSFGSVDAAVIDRLRRRLPRRFNRLVTDDLKLDIPPGSYNRKRDQYLAGAFLQRLREAPGPGVKYLGVTEVDLYTTGLNLVFGQADVGGTAAIISLARLRLNEGDGPAPQLFHERTATEAVHELGHTFGLEHCRDHRCVMHFSHDISETDIKGDSFCPRHEVEMIRADSPQESGAGAV